MWLYGRKCCKNYNPSTFRYTFFSQNFWMRSKLIIASFLRRVEAKNLCLTKTVGNIQSQTNLLIVSVENTSLFATQKIFPWGFQYVFGKTSSFRMEEMVPISNEGNYLNWAIILIGEQLQFNHWLNWLCTLNQRTETL